jgi:hypothetical protein
MTSGTQPDFLSIVISREDIEAGDISSTVQPARQDDSAAGRPCIRPSTEQLVWHNENRYRP